MKIEVVGGGFLAFWAAATIGYIANIIQTISMLVNLDRFADITGYQILQIVGIFFAPLGSVLGWIGMF